MKFLEPLKQAWREARLELIEKGILPQNRVIAAEASLYGRVIRADGSVQDCGLLGTNAVTNEFVDMLCDHLAGEAVTINNFDYHVSGTGTGADIAGATEASITGATPAPIQGTSVKSGSTIYESVATIPYVSTLSITQHGLINNATKSGSKLLDCTQFTAIPVDNGDSIEFTYQLTITAGG